MGYDFAEFLKIVERLRSEDGCPWDRAQTHESLRSCMIEETYEAVSAVNRRDAENLCEELGDMLLQIVLHSRIAEEEGEFGMADVVDGIARKMIRRHPHVFGPKNSAAVPDWEEIKRAERAGKPKQGMFEGIPEEFPALIRAQKTLKRAADAGEAPGREEESLEEIRALLEAWESASQKPEELFADVIVHCVNILRLRGIHAETAVLDRLEKYTKSRKSGEGS